MQYVLAKNKNEWLKENGRKYDLNRRKGRAKPMIKLNIANCEKCTEIGPKTTIINHQN